MAAGINQVNHKVWLDIDTTVQVVVPLFADQIHISRRIVLIDKMVSGKVPPNYVNVLPNNVLDGIDAATPNTSYNLAP